MSVTDDSFTFNELNNEDKALLLSHGYKPGELEPEDERQLVRDLRDQLDGDEDSEHLSGAVPDFERDGTE
ncbi:hypothetical protein EYC59_04870 [Candidatus Saccharibacteria bacterium]|nr:MAG: hypothetical protein EYC59_04870 [Candidatus Saccharibacteria bacterium]